MIITNVLTLQYVCSIDILHKFGSVCYKVRLIGMIVVSNSTTLFIWVFLVTVHKLLTRSYHTTSSDVVIGILLTVSHIYKHRRYFSMVYVAAMPIEFGIPSRICRKCGENVDRIMVTRVHTRVYLYTILHKHN